ncbi:sigma factor [Actinomadura citrea]|uniref:RNA polymerase sigma-70 factor (ECF subfamily) n=1 Tax=Actinomadura citrea TaxID=46158 RepID=A0A7Y9GEK0_9ACTN|nr:sigma factor [Actinomadura citrea]NYE14936.1 RNA polymerase sigma-70 factor (ECF subfamily) [Actinomadura citrea]GGU11275.1 RNA polymerase sigma factor [Actinomadura citrea]
MTGPDASALASLAEMLDERRHLVDIATWMFGSAAAAEEIVQETYRRWYVLDDRERAAIALPRAWLTRVAGGICLELIASTAAAVPSDPALPSPVRRPAPSSTPGLADGRARPGRDLPSRAMLRRHDRIARRFAAACGAADTAALMAVLAAEAIVVSDGGGKLRAAVHPTHGADAVARFITALLSGRPRTAVTVGSVNGRTGLVLRREGRTVAVVSVSTAGDEVTAVWIVLNPAKLGGWHRP